MPLPQPESFDAQSLTRCRSSIPPRRKQRPLRDAGDSPASRFLVAPLAGLSWALAAYDLAGWTLHSFAGWGGLLAMAAALAWGLHRLIDILSAGPRGPEVGPTARALVGLALVPVALWAGRSIGRGGFSRGLAGSTLPSIGVTLLLSGFLPFRRSLKGPWLLDLVGAAGPGIVATALFARSLAIQVAGLAPWGTAIAVAAGCAATVAFLIAQGTALDLIDVRLRWQRLAYLAQWPLPLLYLSWERWIGLALLLVSWWDLFRIGRRTAGGRVVFEGTSDILSIPALAALLTLAPEGRNLDLPALALAGRFLLGWLSAGPYVALLMAFLPDPRTGPSALEFVAPALLTIGLRQLLIRPIGWLWAWGGWVTWLIVMEPPVGLAFAVGTLPALAGIVRLSYRYEPRPLAIALVWASAAGAILAFGHGPIDSLRALLIDWGGSLRVGSHPSPIGIPGAPRFAVDWPVGTWILAVPLLGWLAYREWGSQSPRRVTAAI
ncbi:MAG: hypothetical protein U0800_27875, partial [Isosphaeraceae bacterium]